MDFGPWSCLNSELSLVPRRPHSLHRLSCFTSILHDRAGHRLARCRRIRRARSPLCSFLIFFFFLEALRVLYIHFQLSNFSPKNGAESDWQRTHGAPLAGASLMSCVRLSVALQPQTTKQKFDNVFEKFARCFCLYRRR